MKILKIIIAISILTYRYNCLEFSEFLNDVIHYMFQEANCLYYVSNNSLPLVEKSVASLMIPLFQLNSEKKGTKIHGKSCCGYILALKEFKFIKKIFSAHEEGFRVHQKILIFFNEFKNYQLSVFDYGVGMMGLDVLIVQGLYEKRWLQYTSSTLETGIKHIDLRNATFEKYNITIFSIRENIEIGYWNENKNYLDIHRLKHSKWEPKFNAGNGSYKFIVSVFECKPFVYCDKKHGVYDGIEYMIVEEATKSWPVEYRIHYQNDSSLWTVTLNSVANHTSNIALCSPFQMSVAKRNLDMTTPYMQSCLTFLVPKPSLLPQETYVLQPLQRLTWCVTFVFVVFIAFALTIIAKIYKNVLNTDKGSQFGNFSNSFTKTFGILALISLNKFPKQSESAFRFIVTAWFLTTLLISTGYSGGFTSSLTSPRYNKAINTFKDMIDQNIYWGVPETDSVRTLRSASNPYLQELSNRFVLEKTSSDRSQRLRKNNYAIIIKQIAKKHLTDVDNLDNYEVAHLKLLSECIGSYPIVFPLNKNSAFTNIFNKYIVRFVEHGFISKWISKLTRNGDVESSESFYSSYTEVTSVQKALSISKIQGALYILLFGYILAIIIFIYEIFSNRFISK